MAISGENHLVNIIVRILGDDNATSKALRQFDQNSKTVQKRTKEVAESLELERKRVQDLAKAFEGDFQRGFDKYFKSNEKLIKQLREVDQQRRDSANTLKKEAEEQAKRQAAQERSVIAERAGAKAAKEQADAINKKAEAFRKETNNIKRAAAVQKFYNTEVGQRVSKLEDEIHLQAELSSYDRLFTERLENQRKMNRLQEEALVINRKKAKFDKTFFGSIRDFFARPGDEDISRFSVRLREFSDNGDRVTRALARMGHAMIGLVITGVLVFMESFLTALVALVAQAIALASSLGHAAGVLVGTFIPAVAQAIPVIGVLIGVFQRLGLITQAIEEQDNALKEASGGLSAQLERQRDAADAVANAQRNLKEAQEGLTDARAEARRELQDLVLAERAAELAAKGATLSLAEAQAELRNAIREGRTSEIERLQLGVQEAKLGQRESRVGLRRAREDRAAPGGRVENTETFINATKRLADAQRQLASAQRNAAVAAKAETAAQSNLKEAIDELTPAERKLMKTITRIRDRAMKIFQPMSDTIIRSIDRGLRGAEKLLDDNRLVKGFTDISNELARQIDKGFNFLTNRRNVKFFADTIGEAVKNLRPIGRILRNAFRIFRNISEGAAPTFRKVLKGIAGFFEDIAEATSDKKGVNKFFETGLRHLSAWVQFLGAVFNLFIALAGVSEEAGLQTLVTFTETIRGATDGIRENSGPIKEFFESTGPVLSDIGEILVALGEALIDVFDPATFEAFKNIIVEAIIPALIIWIELIGLVVKGINEFLKLPFATDILKIGTAFLFVGGTIKLMTLIIGQLIGGLGLLSEAFLFVVNGGLKKFIFDLGTKLKGKLDTLYLTFQYAKERIAQSGFAQALGDQFSQMFTRMGEAKQAVTQWVGEIFTKIRTSFNTRFPKLAAFMRRYWAGLGVAAAVGFALALWFILDKETKIKLGDIGISLGETFINGFIDAVNKGLETIVDKFTSFINPAGPLGPLIELAGIDVPSLDDVIGVPNIPNIDLKTYSERAAEAKEETDNLRDSQKDLYGTWDAGKPISKKHMDYIRGLRDTYPGLKTKTEETTGAVKEQTKAAKRAANRGLGPLIGTLFGAGEQSENLGDTLRGVTNKILKAFGADELSFDIPKISKLVGRAVGGIGSFLGFGQVGGFMGSPFDRGPDDRLIGVAGGEAVLTGHHQRPVERAMEFANAAGVIPFGSLNEMFRRDQRTHSSAPMNFQRGGRVPRPPNIVGLGNWLITKGYAVGEHPRFGGIQGDHGNYGPADHYHGGAIDVNADSWPGGEFAAINKIAGQLAAAGWHVLWQVADHYDHLHADIGSAASQIGAGGVGTPRIPRIKIGGKDSALKDMLQAQSDKLRGAANKNLRKKLAHGDGGAGVGGANFLTRGQIGNVAKRALSVLNLPITDQSIDNLIWLAMQESTGNTRAINLTDSNARMGDPSRGLMQVIGSTFNAHKLPGFDNIWNPLHNMIASIRYQLSRYGGIIRFSPYERGGMVPEFDQGGIVPGPIGSRQKIIAHGGETVLPTHQKGGFAKGVGFSKQGDIMRDVIKTDVFKLGPKNLRELLNALVSGFTRLTEAIALATEKMVTNLTLATFKVKGGVVKKVLSDQQIFKRQIRQLDRVANSYEKELNQINRSEKDLKKELNNLKGKKGKKAKAQRQKIRAALNELDTQRDEVESALASTYEQLFQAQGDLIRSRLSKWDNRIGRTQQRGTIRELDEQIAGTGINVQSRLQNLGVQRNLLFGQRNALQNALSEAQRIGDKDLINELKSAILDNEIALRENTLAQKEVFKQKFEETLSKFADRLSSLGLDQRVTELMSAITGGFNTGGRLGDISRQGGLLAQQRSEIERQLREARARGDDQELIQQMESALKENTIAQLENTLAIREVWKQHFEKLMSAIAVRVSRLDIRKRIAEITAEIEGSPLTQAVLAQFNQDRRALILEERQVIIDALSKARELGDVDEVDRLETALLENELALLENTKELQDINKQFNVQNFSSTAWKLFRRAIFTGSGQIIPQLQSTIPSLQSGGLVTKTGMVNVHAGEVVTPAPDIGDQHFHFTQPMEVADPQAIASTIAFRLKTEKASR